MGDVEGSPRHTCRMSRTKLVAAIVLVGAMIGAVLLGGTASAQEAAASVNQSSQSSNRAW
jgi:hypothetical protein